MGSIMRCSVLLLLVSVLGSVYLAPLDDAMSSQNGGHSADMNSTFPHPEFRVMTDVPHTTTLLTSFDTTAVDGSSSEALTTITESVPTSTLEGAVPPSPSTSHPAAPIVAASNPVTPESALNTDTPITDTTVMGTSLPVMIEGKRDVTDTDTTTAAASSTAATSATTTITVSDSTSAETTVTSAVSSTAATTNADSPSTTADTTTAASTTATPVKMVAADATSPASTVNAADINISTGTVVAAHTVTSASTITTAHAIVAASTNISTTDEGTSTASPVAKSGTEGLMVSAERQGKSLGEEDKSTASTANTTASVSSTGTSTSILTAAEHFTKEEVNPRKPWDNLVAQRQEEATSPTGAEPSETTLPTTVASTTVPSTSAETTVASTSVTAAAAETRAGKAITHTIPPPECAIILNSTLIQRRELFVPEELLSDSERLPTAFAEGRVPQWAREQCVTILTMLQPLNETCEAEKVDRVSKFRSVALTAVWDYLCIQNASNLIAMVNQASTCYQGMPVLSQECGLLNKLGFVFHYPSELVLTPRVLKEGECRDVNSTNVCLKERIRGMQSKCTAVQMDHMVAVLDLLFKSVKCDQVPPTPAPPKSAGTHPLYSLWSLVLAVILVGFY